MTETPAGNTEVQQQQMLAKILETAKSVILKPTEFFRSMAKTGGFGDPLVFMVVVGLVAAVVQLALGLLHLIPFFSLRMALGMFIGYPIAALIGGFIFAAIMFVIWKLMGSQESYEASYRCVAYAGAISPISMLFHPIPYVGGLVGLAWGLLLIVIASVEVHKIKAKTAWLVFGIITALLALGSLSAQRKARQFSGRMSEFQKEFGGKSDKEMTPEDAGRAAAAFMKAMQESAAKKAEKDAKKDDDK